MKVNLNLEEIKSIVEANKEYKNIPLATTILSDVRTPIELVKIFKQLSNNVYILESASHNETWGRYTFLGYNPKLEITALDGIITIKENGETITKEGNIDEEIRKIIAKNKSPQLEDLPYFTGGLVGYFSYDYIKYAEPSLKLDAKDSEDFKDLDLMLFDKVIAYDNYRQKIIIITNIKTENIEQEYKKGIEELKEITNLIKNGLKEPNKEIQKGKLTSDFRNFFSKEEFCSMVEKAKNYIYEGDIFQVVLSNRVEADFEGSLLDTYRVLRTTNPSPYMFYFSSNNIEIAGASPETLVKLENGNLKTFPLAGTRKRGANKKEDELLKQDLLADEKETAEHNMLVDLGRNDLGKISKFNTVEVEDYMSIELFSHVMHISSTVVSKIQDSKDSIDAIKAVLPAGTLSGAPKIRACEIINELENDKRGIYGGAIGYIDFSGNMDTCIAIRIAYKKNNKVFIRAGAGIVMDSVPENEYIECINKAKAIKEALEIASDEGGIAQ